MRENRRKEGVRDGGNEILNKEVKQIQEDQNYRVTRAKTEGIQRQ